MPYYIKNRLKSYHLKAIRCVSKTTVNILLFNVLYIVIVFNDIISELREQRLITKEHIAYIKFTSV